MSFITSIERTGYVNVLDMFTDITTDMTSGGAFTKIFDDTNTIGVWTLEATGADNLLGSEQPWRVQFNANDPTRHLVFGTNLQLPNDGTLYTDDNVVLSDTDTFSPSTDSIIGNLGMFVNTQSNDDGRIRNAFPWGYRLSIAQHGFTLETWQEEAIGPKDEFSALCVQRLVDPNTGSIPTSGRSPVMALYTSYGPDASRSSCGDEMYYFVVREKDINGPCRHKIANTDQDYINSVINVRKQMSISETGSHFITFPNGFNTNRYMYLEEMDLMAYTGAQVISQFNNAKVTVYEEASERNYKAGHANQSYSAEGMRLLFLTDAPAMP